MTEREWALLLHLSGVLLLFAGMTVAAVAQAGARRREAPGEIAALLGLTRVGVALVAAGALVIVGGGLWLIEASSGVYSLGDGWIAGSLGLLALSFVLGAIGGRRPKRARRLAAQLARDRDEPPEELRALLDDRLSDAFNYGAAIAVIAALVLMVWKPGL
ncbi:MAG TPA: DUF2269 family protein [Gaiellaceae bacterium]|nr:DUF2269 family protein [Gaiellaceae bacterium]